jgi:hypothetical protein
MTFVVGRQGENGAIRVVADMRLTDTWEIRRGYPVAVLKNVILNNDLLVAYAGNAAMAVHTIRELKDASREDLVAGLLHSSVEAGDSEQGVSYLIADVNVGLQRVRHTGVEPPGRTGWVGDQKAFEIYQAIYHGVPKPQVLTVEGISPPEPPPDTPDTEAFLRMSGALAQMQMLDDIESIGEAQVSAFSRNGFHYEPQAFLAASNEQIFTGPEWEKVNWGSVADGGFGYCLLHPTDPGIGIVGLHFPHRDLGFLYHPLCYDGPAIYRDVSHEEFRAAVEEDHNVPINGPRVA